MKRITGTIGPFPVDLTVEDIEDATPVDPEPPVSGYKFRSNFAADTNKGWQGTPGPAPIADAPFGWDSRWDFSRVEGGGATLDITDGQLRSGYRKGAAQAGTCGLGVNLPNLSQIHVRLEFKYSEGWTWGDNAMTQIHKLMRLWQPGITIEGNNDFGYIIPRIVFNRANPRMPALSIVACQGNDKHDSNDSAGKRDDHPVYDLPNMIGEYITIDMFFKLETALFNGIIRVWINGDKQLDTRLRTGRQGGFSQLWIMDNLQGVCTDWTEQHYVHTRFVGVWDTQQL